MSRTPPRRESLPSRRPGRIIAWLLMGGGLLVGVALWPVTTSSSVDFRVEHRRIPLAVKLMTFLVRDYEYRRLARAITAGCSSDLERAEAIGAWTQTHIRPTPRSWPVVDDHVYHIVVRGYGDDDQAADVFTTLAAYAGIPAFWKITRARTGGEVVVLSFARIDGRWTVWDVRRGGVFRNADGRPADLDALRADPELVQRSVGEPHAAAQAYRIYVEDALASMEIPETPRAYKHMPARRALFELQRVWQRMHGGG